MDNKLKIKDLVTIGVFGLIYLVGMFAIGMMGVVPILFLVYPAVLGLLMGPVTMLFMAKVRKPWALFIFGMIAPSLMFAMGHTYVVFLHGIFIMIIAEVIRRRGSYQSLKANVLSNGVFNLWICGSLMQMLVVKDRYMEMARPMMGDQYVDALEALINLPNMSLVYLSAFIAGILGGLVGYKMLKKHFIKAGITR